jgi:hypothetical protein
MVKILTFRPLEPNERSRSADAARSDTWGEVVVFPGVRYEHWDEASQDEPQSSRDAKRRTHARRRDILDLAE